MNRLFLYKSIDALNFNDPASDIGAPVFSVGTVRVARFENVDAKEHAEDCITQARKQYPEHGFFFRKIDDEHLLVPECTEEKIAMLGRIAPGAHWKDFGKWKEGERMKKQKIQRRFSGIVKAAPSPTSLGLIASFEAHQIYGRDVHLHNRGVQVGQRASFTVQTDAFRNPVAYNLILLSADRRFIGKIKQFNERKGFGFVSCTELMLGFGKPDAFLTQSEVAGFIVGDLVSFQIRCNQKGQVQAHNLTLADQQTKLTAVEIGSIKMFDPKKRFGFIVSKSLSDDVFFHLNDILMPDAGALRAGNTVEFDVAYPDPAGKPHAKNVRIPQLLAPFAPNACPTMKSVSAPTRREDADGTATSTPSSSSSSCGSDDGSCDRRALQFQ